MQYRTRYKGEVIEIHAFDLCSTKRDMNLCCFTTPNFLCEFGIIWF